MPRDRVDISTSLWKTLGVFEAETREAAVGKAIDSDDYQRTALCSMCVADMGEPRPSLLWSTAEGEPLDIQATEPIRYGGIKTHDNSLVWNRVAECIGMDSWVSSTEIEERLRALCADTSGEAPP